MADTSASQWVEKFSAKHNRKYWKNSSSGEVIWKDPYKVKATNGQRMSPQKPEISTGKNKAASPPPPAVNEPAPAAEGEWVEMFSKKHNRKYWKHKDSGETTWKMPQVQESASPSPRAAIETTAMNSAADLGAWDELFSKKHNRKYWKNRTTGKVTWKDPSRGKATAAIGVNKELGEKVVVQKPNGQKVVVSSSWKKKSSFIGAIPENAFSERKGNVGDTLSKKLAPQPSTSPPPPPNLPPPVPSQPPYSTPPPMEASSKVEDHPYAVYESPTATSSSSRRPSTQVKYQIDDGVEMMENPWRMSISSSREVSPKAKQQENYDAVEQGNGGDDYEDINLTNDTEQREDEDGDLFSYTDLLMNSHYQQIIRLCLREMGIAVPADSVNIDNGDRQILEHCCYTLSSAHKSLAQLLWAALLHQEVHSTADNKMLASMKSFWSTNEFAQVLTGKLSDISAGRRLGSADRQIRTTSTSSAADGTNKSGRSGRSFVRSTPTRQSRLLHRVLMAPYLTTYVAIRLLLAAYTGGVSEVVFLPIDLLKYSTAKNAAQVACEIARDIADFGDEYLQKFLNKVCTRSFCDMAGWKLRPGKRLSQLLQIVAESDIPLRRAAAATSGSCWSSCCCCFSCCCDPGGCATDALKRAISIRERMILISSDDDDLDAKSERFQRALEAPFSTKGSSRDERNARLEALPWDDGVPLVPMPDGQDLLFLCGCCCCCFNVTRYYHRNSERPCCGCAWCGNICCYRSARVDEGNGFTYEKLGWDWCHCLGTERRKVKLVEYPVLPVLTTVYIDGCIVDFVHGMRCCSFSHQLNRNCTCGCCCCLCCMNYSPKCYCCPNFNRTNGVD